MLVAATVLAGFEASAQQPTDRPGDATSSPEARTGYVSTEGQDVADAISDLTGGIATDIPMQGLVYDGLKRASKKSKRCRQGYQGKTKDGKKICTHGPDAAPAGIDARERPRTGRLRAATAAAADAVGTPSLPCYGDGQSGNRVQAIYAHASDVADRSAEILPLMTQWAANADQAFNVSAMQTGGRRHVLWATTPSCTLSVQTAVLSSSGDDSLTDTINELKAQGYTRTDRKYLVWTDAARYCGIAEIKSDDQSGAGNVHNFGPMFGRVDSACWGSSASVEAHELMHMLGGIQLSAPHSSGGWHCTDENDRMCLPDIEGRAMSYSCPDTTNEALFDCGHDDYFSTAPPPGSYLATHWNAADNVFLSAAVPDACSTMQIAAAETVTKKRRHRRGHRRHRAAPAPASTAVTAVPCTPS